MRMRKVRVSIVDTAPVRVDIIKGAPVRVDVLSTVVERTDVERYKGPYSAYPDAVPITLETKDKMCTDNITIFRIPLWEVSNPTGTTIYIGGERKNGK